MDSYFEEYRLSKFHSICAYTHLGSSCFLVFNQKVFSILVLWKIMLLSNITQTWCSPFGFSMGNSHSFIKNSLLRRRFLQSGQKVFLMPGKTLQEYANETNSSHCLGYLMQEI